MIKNIKMYFKMKKLERQMKYELLSHLYLFVTEKEAYLNLFHEIAKTSPDEMNDKFFGGLAELIHNDAQKERAVKVSE